ncbi:hypothetical protein Nepgr_016535 [Nepenthes gracilis]|uniref:DUF7798 domain-containing protein n=1 Tax=Nepenthes gracilis TaxID=150966 RepID=A0AAD3SPW0_NEPGR|nr:hypothetical protein Nepgr_016535 [Nepenthes gracilis]
MTSPLTTFFTHNCPIFLCRPLTKQPKQPLAKPPSRELLLLRPVTMLDASGMGDWEEEKVDTGQVYTVGPKYPILLTPTEKQIAREVCMALQQMVCGFDLLRCGGRSYVCDVNGWSIVQNSHKYYNDAACVLRKQMSAAAFAKGLLDLEGQLAPILVSLVSKDSSMLDGLENASTEIEAAKARLNESITFGAQTIHGNGSIEYPWMVDGAGLLPHGSELLPKLAELTKKITEQVRVIEGLGNLPKVVLTSVHGCEADIYLFGACITSWKIPNGKDVLFVRPDAIFNGQKPISGGIPHCFPQFGPGPIQQHGFARNMDWSLVDSENVEGKPVITLELKDSPYSRAMKAFSFTAALDTYFRASVTAASVRGLKGCKTLNKDPDPKNPREALEEGEAYVVPPYDITQIPDVYDSCKYDLLHNAHLNLEGVDELFKAVQAAAVAKSISDRQNTADDSESTKEEDVEKSEIEEEDKDEMDKQRKFALDNLEEASEDSLLSQGLKVIDNSMENFVSGAWQALRRALTRGSNFIQKLEHSAMNIAESLQHGGADAITAESKQGKKIETRSEISDNELKSLHVSSINKAADMAAGFTSSLAGLSPNDIIQRTASRLESLHSERVHRLSEICCFAVSQLLILGKSILSSANKTHQEESVEDLMNVEWLEDSLEKAKTVRTKAHCFASHRLGLNRIERALGKLC